MRHSLKSKHRIPPFPPETIAFNVNKNLSKPYPKLFPPQNIVLTQIHFWPTDVLTFFSPTQILFDPNFFDWKIIFWQNFFFQLKIVLDPIFFSTKKCFWPKIILLTKIIVDQQFTKIFLLRIIFNQKLLLTIVLWENKSNGFSRNWN